MFAPLGLKLKNVCFTKSKKIQRDLLIRTNNSVILFSLKIIEENRLKAEFLKETNI